MSERFTIHEMAIYPKGIDPMADGWVPCSQPERPVNHQAAVKHVVNGRRCRACDIAWEAVGRQADAAIARASYEEDDPS